MNNHVSPSATWNSEEAPESHLKVQARASESASPRRVLGALNSNLCRLINILFRKAELGIESASIVLEIAVTIRIKDSGVQHLGETDPTSLLYLLDATGVTLVRWLFRDGPVRFLGTRHAKSRRKHVLLADSKGVNVNHLVRKVLETGFFVVTLGLDGQAEERGNSTTNLAKVSSPS